MVKIGLLSDTHGFFDPQLFDFFKETNEIWHAGDVGDILIIDTIKNFKPLKAVYGNIDGFDIRSSYSSILRFTCEEVDVLLTHIGGYPGKYEKNIFDIIKVNPPRLFICGHSHILKIIYDKKYDFLHINPGAAGRYGFQKKRTAIRFTINKKEISDMEIIELN